jgi:TP901 family phage tail tape measure protein
MGKGIQYVIEFVDKFSGMAERYTRAFSFMERQTRMVDRAVAMIPKSMSNLEDELIALRTARSQAFDTKEIKQFNMQINGIENKLKSMNNLGLDPPVNTSGLQRMGNMAKDLLATLGLLGGVTMAISFGNESMDYAAKISDGMASVAKTTGMADDKMLDFRKNLQALDTRTNLEDLLKIGEIGGQLGIAEKDILGFTKVTDQMVVALRSDFGGSAEEVATKIGVLSNLFPKLVENGMPVPELMSRIGSGLNGLGDSGAADAKNVADFVTRLAPAMKSLNPESLMAYGAILQEKGINSEIAASGMQNFFSKVLKDTDKFAAIMGTTKVDIYKMFDTDAGVQKLIKDFGNKMKNLENSEQLKIMSHLELAGNNEVMKFVGALTASMNTMGKEDIGVSRFEEMFDISKKLFAENTSLSKEFDKMNNTLAAQLDKQSKKYDETKLKLGEMLIPFKLQAMEIGSGVLSWLVGLFEKMEGKKGLFESLAVGAGVFGLALALANLPALSLLASQMMLALTNPFALTIYFGLAVAGLFSYLYYKSENFRGILWALYEVGKVVFEGFYNVGKTAFSGLINLVMGLVDMIEGLFALDFGKVGSGLNRAVNGVKEGTFGVLKTAFLETNDKVPQLFGAASKGFAAGKADYAKDKAVALTPDYVTKSEKAMGANLFGMPMGDVLPKGVGAGDSKLFGGFGMPKGFDGGFSFGNLGSSLPTNDDKNAGGSSLKDGIDTIAGGGSKPTTINITIGKLNEKIEIHTNNLDEASVDVESKLTEMMLRVVNNANQAN